MDAWREGERDLWKIAERADSTPSYAASVLQAQGHISGYHDLFNTPENPVNIYSRELQGRLGFKDAQTAIESVNVLDETFQRLGILGDRAGQHHCMVAALTLFNRARALGKTAQADRFRQWLMKCLLEEDSLPDDGLFA